MPGVIPLPEQIDGVCPLNLEYILPHSYREEGTEGFVLSRGEQHFAFMILPQGYADLLSLS